MKKTCLIFALILSIMPTLAVTIEKTGKPEYFYLLVNKKLVKTQYIKDVRYSSYGQCAEIYYITGSIISIPMSQGEERVLENRLAQEVRIYHDWLKKQAETMSKSYNSSYVNSKASEEYAKAQRAEYQKEHDRVERITKENEQKELQQNIEQEQTTSSDIQNTSSNSANSNTYSTTDNVNNTLNTVNSLINLGRSFVGY